MKTTETATLDCRQALSSAAKNLFNFRGRARRSEFWWVRIFISLLGFIWEPLLWGLDLLCIPLAIRRLHDAGHSGWWLAGRWAIDIAAKVYYVSNALSREKAFNFFADNGFSYEQLGDFFVTYGIAYIVQIAAFFTLLVFWCQDSEPRTNKWGASNKYPEEQ